jgi:hypothetical protein
VSQDYEDYLARTLCLAEVTEQGVTFRTGMPVTFRYVRGTRPAPQLGSKYQQDLEPAGRYMVHNETPGDLRRDMETGIVTFQSPLVILLTADVDRIYGPGSWKARLARHYGLVGAELSQALLAEGFDGIVTVGRYQDHRGIRPPVFDTREIVDLRVVRQNPLRCDYGRVAFSDYRGSQGKKRTALFTGPGRRTVHFGAQGYEDYTMHHDPERRRRYVERHGRGRENWDRCDTPGALSRWVLWGNSTSRTKNESEFRRRFGLKGNPDSHGDVGLRRLERAWKAGSVDSRAMARELKRRGQLESALAIEHKDQDLSNEENAKALVSLANLRDRRGDPIDLGPPYTHELSERRKLKFKNETDYGVWEWATSDPWDQVELANGYAYLLPFSIQHAPPMHKHYLDALAASDIGVNEFRWIRNHAQGGVIVRSPFRTAGDTPRVQYFTNEGDLQVAWDDLLNTEALPPEPPMDWGW